MSIAYSGNLGLVAPMIVESGSGNSSVFHCISLGTKYILIQCLVSVGPGLSSRTVLSDGATVRAKTRVKGFAPGRGIHPA